MPVNALTTALILAVSWISLSPPAPAQRTDTPALVSRQALVEAMKVEKAKRYNILATSNGARLSSAVILDVARRAADRDRERKPILIDHRDYFEAYLEVTGLTADKAPAFMRIARDHREDQYVDYRQEKVIGTLVTGSRPRFAVNVIAGWPDGPNVPQSYSYEDRTSSPALRVTHKRINSYRILDYEGMLVYDDVQGVFGRALGGMLGAMFMVIGDGRAVRSFIALSNDGLQVTVTTAKKGFITVTQEAVVYPDGRGEKGLPRNRPDLSAIEARLRQPFEIRYVPLSYPEPSKWRASAPPPGS